MIEYGFIGAGYRILKDIFSFARGKKRSLSSSDRVQLRQKWKKEFEEVIAVRRRDKLRMDVIIRDMKRIDKYPDVDDKEKGISSWFKAGLMGTYHKGIQAGLSWGSLKIDDQTGKYRFVDRKNKEEGDIKVMLIGLIPYENIEATDWEGDEYGGHPHIYCHFTEKQKQPYERLIFCEQRQLDHFTYYSEVADYEEVRKLSKKHKIEYFA